MSQKRFISIVAVGSCVGLGLSLGVLELSRLKQPAVADTPSSKKLLKPLIQDKNPGKPLIEFKTKTRRKARSRQEVLAQIKSARIPLSEIITPWDSKKPLPPTKVLVKPDGLEPRGYVTHLTFRRTLTSNLIFFSGLSSADYGTIFDLYLNGQFVKQPILGPIRESVELEFQPGENTLDFVPVAITGGAAYIRIDYYNILPGENPSSSVYIQTGINTSYRPLGFPQIVIPKSRFPESAKHIESAWAGRQSRPIGTNPSDRLGIPKKSPRLVTIDRLNAPSRKGKATAGITCKEKHKNNKGVFQLDQPDEYPPVVTRESFQKVLGVTTTLAHVRCIPSSDNGGSGSFAARQHNGYATTPTATPTMVPNNSTIEFVIGP
jgi:hypothetical protein